MLMVMSGMDPHMIMEPGMGYGEVFGWVVSKWVY
jgi:hypothetical protein